MEADHTRASQEFMRFCITGILAVLLNTGLIVAFTEGARLHYLISIVVTFTATTGFGLVMNRQWTFVVDGRIRRNEAVRYFAISVLGVCATLIVAAVLVGKGVPYYVASLAVAFVLAPINFVLHRGWSFGLDWVATRRSSQ